MSGGTGRSIKLACHERSHVYTGTWICPVRNSEVQFSTVVRSSLSVHSDWNKKNWTGISFLHQDIIPSPFFRISDPALLFNLTYETSCQTRLTLKQKLGIIAAIDSEVHYNALIPKYQVRKRTLTQIRKDYATIRKCSDAGGTTTLAKQISWAT